MKKTPEPYGIYISDDEKNAAILAIDAAIADWILRNPDHAPPPRDTKETAAWPTR